MSNENPVIEFKSYRVTSIDFKVFDSPDELEGYEINGGEISAAVSINEEFTQALVKLETSVIDEANLRIISVEVTGQFSIIEKDREKSVNYLRVNGTAILMPYLRTIVSILSSLDNENSIILPTINTNSFNNNN